MEVHPKQPVSLISYFLQHFRLLGSWVLLSGSTDVNCQSQNIITIETNICDNYQKIKQISFQPPSQFLVTAEETILNTV